MCKHCYLLHESNLDPELVYKRISDVLRNFERKWLVANAIEPAENEPLEYTKDDIKLTKAKNTLLLNVKVMDLH